MKDPAHNPRARAPEHVQLVQSLGGADHTQHKHGTHLGTVTDWDKLSVHLEHVAAPLTRCCFQCGMLNYPTPGDTIRVTNVGSRQECRAYRVFRYYIRELVKGERGRLRACSSDADATSEAARKVEAYNNVFLCEPTTDNAACKVYACSHCKRACRRRDANGKLYYAQCSGTELDLFDGHTADGEYESIGIGEKQAPEYAACSVHDRLALGVLKMANATFKGYGGAGYIHSAGGGLLHPGDFEGMSALLVESSRSQASGREASQKGSLRNQRAALRRLMDPMVGNPLVRRTLTCLERELNGSQATIPEDNSDSDSSGEDEHPRGRAQAQLHDPPAFLGAVTSCLPLDSAAYHESLTQEAVIGDKRQRDGQTVTQPMDTDEPRASADNAANTILFPKGAGGRADTEQACTWKHYRRKMLGSVADVFGRAEEFLWYHFQLMTKRSMQSSSVSTVNPHLAKNATRGDVDEHAAELRERWADLRCAAPEYVPYCNVRESFTGSVGTNVIGSKAYWNESAAELMAMAIEYGPPQYWATFTCNETGWSDLKAACRGEHHSKRPIEATRQYNRRWDAFLKKYLRGNSPIGDITRVWWRQEDQARGSLHVHIVFWVAEAEGRAFDDTTELPGDKAILGTAPRECRTREERAWRKFVLRLQRHDCRPKCHKKMGEACKDCKYGYPRRSNRERGTTGLAIDPATGRYEYDCEYEEDQRLSPYVSEWLLAWGASMNIQRCTGTGFMDYTSKCAPRSKTTLVPARLHPCPATTHTTHYASYHPHHLVILSSRSLVSAGMCQSLRPTASSKTPPSCASARRWAHRSTSSTRASSASPRPRIAPGASTCAAERV